MHLFRPFRGPLPAKLKKADADWEKAYADWKKAGADWQKAGADWEKAYADWQKAYDDWKKAGAEIAHKKQCKGCPWNGKTIFVREP